MTAQTAWERYQGAIQQELRALQRDERFDDTEMMLYFPALVEEAVVRLYVLGQYEEPR